MNRIRLFDWCVAALAGSSLFGCDAAPTSPAPVQTEAQLQALHTKVAAALAEADPYRRVHQLASLLPDVAPGAGPELKRTLEVGAKNGMGVAEFELLVRAWAAQDPEAATNWVLEQSASHVRVSAIEAAVEAWARTDPKAAVAGVTWAAQIADKEVAQAVQQGLVRGWFQVDRPALEKYIDDLGIGIEQQRSMLFYAFAFQRAEGSDALMRWAAAIPDQKDQYKRAVFQQVANALAWSDPPAAERWCDAQCEGPFGKALRTTIVRVRIQNNEDGGPILDWLGRSPESEGQLHALQVGYQVWAIRDDAAATRWMQEKIQAGAEPWVKKLYGPYAIRLATKSPADALHWAEQIEDEEARTQLLVRIARRWRRQDQAAADAWIQQSPLAEPQRAKARDLTQPDYLPEAIEPSDTESAG